MAKIPGPSCGSSSLIQLLCLWSICFGNAVWARLITSRDVGNSSYDYVIVGGGLSGLVVANRLSEDSSKTVLVVEYGYLDNSPRTLIPYDATSLNYGDMYEIYSAPVPALDNQTYQVLVGAVVGGGSLVNGMELDRGAAADYDAWETLGNDGWGWDDLLPYFKKASTLTPPTPEILEEFNVNITWNLSFWGDGPLQASYPPWYYPELPTFWSAWDELGVPKPIDGGSGETGVFWTPNSLDPKTETRSSSRSAYYDPTANRTNLHLLTGHTVTEIIFSELTAQGVKITSREDNTTSTAFATKEVILAAGAIFTPQLLMLSGVGPKSELEAAGIDVKVDLPAVGANFQDHPTLYAVFNLTTDDSFPTPDTLDTNTTYNASAYAEYLANRTGPYTAAHGNSVAFLSLPHITNNSATIAAQLSAQNASAYLPSAYSDPTLLAGFLAQRAILIDRFTTTNSAVFELPFSGSGTVTNTLQKPVSRGTLVLNATDPHAYPVLHYNTFANPVDRAIAAAAIRYTRRFFATDALATFGPVEVTPGTAAQSDDEILDTLIAAGLAVPSFAHPSGTCALLPQELGGCVGTDLKVYGTEGLSVVDASVMPLIVGAHLQESVYAVAEKAADLIKARA